MSIRILLIFIIVSTSSGSAQEPVSFGITGGPVFSKPLLSEFGSLPAGTTTSSTFASVSGILRVPLKGTLFIQSEPAYVRKGLVWHETLYGYAYSLTASADYVELPVFLGTSFILGPISTYLMIGPGVAYKLSEKTDFGVNWGSTPDLYVRYDVSLNGGGGLLYRVAQPASILLEARYSFGLNQVNESGSGMLRSSEIRLAAGLLFNL